MGLPNRKGSYSFTSIFRGELLVSGRVEHISMFWGLLKKNMFFSGEIIYSNKSPAFKTLETCISLKTSGWTPKVFPIVERKFFWKTNISQGDTWVFRECIRVFSFNHQERRVEEFIGRSWHWVFFLYRSTENINGSFVLMWPCWMWPCWLLHRSTENSTHILSDTRMGACSCGCYQTL